MILFSDMLQYFTPKHEIQDTVLISTFGCGCTTVITFCGRPNMVGNNMLTEGNGNLWRDLGECSHGHDISFSEISNSKGISAPFLVTEISRFNSINVSVSNKAVLAPKLSQSKTN